jgi:hypothetical protein
MLAIRTVGLVCLPFLFSGCVVPISDHPLSDESNAQLDMQLVGFWEVINSEDDRQTGIRYSIGLAEEKNRTFEAISTEITKSGQIRVMRCTFCAAVIDQQRYVSVSCPDEPGFLILKYQSLRDKARDAPAEGARTGQLLDDDRIELYALHSDRIAAAIDEHRLPGQVRRKARTRPEEVERIENIQISATADELAEFFKRDDMTAWGMQPVLVLRRSGSRPF